MKNIAKLLGLICCSVLLITTSCEDEGGADGFDIDVFPELAKGGFIRFPDGQQAPETVSYADPQNAQFSIGVEDFNDNASSYVLDITATVGGNTYLAEDFLTISSFPGNLTVSMPDVANALGLDLSDINFGDNFAFVATVTTNNGNTFVGIPPSIVTEEDGTLSIGVGNTENQLLTNPASYNSAMSFNFTLACPEFELSELVGTYNVATNLLAPGIGLTDPASTREVILGQETVKLPLLVDLLGLLVVTI